MVEQSVVKLVQQYLRKLQEEGLLVSRAFLFGSVARGTARAESDIDLLLLSPAFEELTWDQQALAWEVAKSLDWRLEPVLCGERTFVEDDWHPLIDTVKKEGIEVRAA